MTYNLSKLALANGGTISQLKFDSSLSKGMGITNPSIFINDKGEYRMVLRNVGYLFYHSEGRQNFQSHWGPLAYLHPENDQTLRTTNFICDLHPDTLEVTHTQEVITETLDIPPVWEFIGLEDARLVEWDGDTILTGVRRDVKPNGEGRMEVSKITENGHEFYRSRIEPPSDPFSYCEKNWMPIEGMPWHYVKWTDPTEVVKVHPNTRSSETVVQKEKSSTFFPRDLRGSSHCIKYKDYYVALTHEVDLWFNEKDNKDSQYYHRFIVWDKDWNIVYSSDELKLLSGGVEFTCGIAFNGKDFLLPFGFQDSTSFIIRLPSAVFENLVGMPNAPLIKEEKEYNNPITLAERFAHDPYNENISFEMGEHYFSEGHYASAMSFYLRTAEYSKNKQLVYDSLCMIANCIGIPGNRPECTRGCWYSALSYDPSRPEAHIKLSELYESKDWHQSYYHAKAAYELNDNQNPRSKYLGYLGKEHALFHYGVASWWLGKFTQSRDILFNLFRKETQRTLPQNYYNIIESNLRFFAEKGNNYPKTETYRKGYHHNLKFPFNGSETIERNYSQAYQDMFILSVLNGKKGGRYFEIGASFPVKDSNTYLLESEFDWAGESIEYEESFVNEFRSVRKNPVYHCDALTYDYSTMEGHYDYLQLDIDPHRATFELLSLIPFDKCTFSVITYEHDDYAHPDNWPSYPTLDITSYRKPAREILESKGYVLVAANIGTSTAYNFEDWYVHPDHVDMDRIKEMIANDDSVKYCVDYMLR